MKGIFRCILWNRLPLHEHVFISLLVSFCSFQVTSSIAGLHMYEYNVKKST